MAVSTDFENTECYIFVNSRFRHPKNSQNLQIDGQGKEIRSEEQLATLISGSLKFLSLGQRDSAAFTGCFRRFIVNNQAQSFDASERNLLAQQV